MNDLVIKFKLVRPGAKLPSRKHADDLGFDLYAPCQVTMFSRQTLRVLTGVAAEFPPGWGALVKERSSQGKQGLWTVSEVVDGGYRGEFSVVLHNSGPYQVTYQPGERIGQLVPIPIFPGTAVEVPELTASDRGEKGFGSTGR